MAEAKNNSKKIVSQNIESIMYAPQIKSYEALLHNSDTSSLFEHNKQYTALLKAYVKDFEQNSIEKKKNKKQLFKIAKGLLIFAPLFTVLYMFITLGCLVFQKIDLLETLPGLFTALASLIGTFMVVPQMITNYLFNKKEENHLYEIISKIQEYDKEIRGGL